MKCLIAAILAFSIFNIQQANAAAWCTGTIKRILIGADGTVAIYPSWRNQWVQICNSHATWDDITPDVCQIWTAQADSIVLSKLQAVVFYSDPIQPSDCASMDVYGSANGSPVPGYVEIYSEE